MKYTKYGTFLGGVLMICILMGYSYLHESTDKLLMPYIYIAMLVYFFLVGYYTCHKTCSIKEGMKAGVIAGVVSMTFVAVAFFFAHTVLYYYDSISDPVNLAHFKSSGLLSMRRYLVYQNIGTGILGIIAGALFSGFSAGAGSFTALHSHTHRIDTPQMGTELHV